MLEKVSHSWRLLLEHPSGNSVLRANAGMIVKFVNPAGASWPLLFTKVVHSLEEVTN